jgi:Cu+-exporting ATPase
MNKPGFVRQEEGLETREIGVTGMSCDNCARRVEKALRNVAGVTEARVDRAAARATVTFDPTKTGIEALDEALVKSGYPPAAIAR